MFIEALILGIIVGLIRKGKIARLAYVTFNMKPLIYISAILYLSIIIMNLGLFDYSSVLYTAVLTLSYIFVGVFLIANLNIKFMFMPLIGFCLNLLVFLANGFKFPLASENAARIYGLEMLNLLKSGKINFFISSKEAVLNYLGNIITIGNFFIVSIGDIIIALGILLVTQSIISDKYIQSRNRITFSKDIFK